MEIAFGVFGLLCIVGFIWFLVRLLMEGVRQDAERRKLDKEREETERRRDTLIEDHKKEYYRILREYMKL